MGALHAGHISLINRAHAENDVVIVSIFVNPLQFNSAEDLEKYPQDNASDIEQLETVNVNAVFTGSPEAFLGESRDKNTEELTDPGIYAQGLEGAHRPGHFAGVREIVSKLFNFVGPCRSYFGEKDYQQLQIIKQMAKDMPSIEVIPCPTMREPSGLAKSSRNARLNERDRQQASIIFKAMQSANALWKNGVRSPQLLQHAMLEILGTSDIELDYAELRDPKNWTNYQPEYDLEQAHVFVAGYIKGVRLIDNMALES